MLILSRREAESVCLGDDVIVTIVSVGNDKIRIGVQAPAGVRILRKELEIRQESPANPVDASAVDASAVERREFEIVVPPALITGSHPTTEDPSSEAGPIILPTPAASKSLGGPLRIHLRNAASQRRAA
jgi:carbon storage regulator CsrA